MLKFRSLRATRGERPADDAKNDPRRTRLGALLRATELDELPQFFNVLWGDMKASSARAQSARVVRAQVREIDPNYNARHAVKAGSRVGTGERLARELVAPQAHPVDLYYISTGTAVRPADHVPHRLRMLFSKQKHAY